MTRLRRMGGLFLIGILVILCIALGALYIQQGARQKELSEQIAKVSLTVAKPLPNDEKLLAEYDEVKRSLSPLTVKEAIMIEPTETESKQSIDEFVDAMIALAELAETDPEAFTDMPATTPVTRLDEVRAARKPDLASLADAPSAP